MRLISSLLQKFWFSSVTIFFFFSFSLDPGWLAVLSKMEMPKWNPLWSHKDGLLCTFPTFLAFTADSDQVPRLYQKAWIVSIIILLLYDDGAKAVLLRWKRVVGGTFYWKEWWVALCGDVGQPGSQDTWQIHCGRRQVHNLSILTLQVLLYVQSWSEAPLAIFLCRYPSKIRVKSHLSESNLSNKRILICETVLFNKLMHSPLYNP